MERRESLFALQNTVDDFFAQQKQLKKEEEEEELFIFGVEISLLLARFFVLEQPVLLYIRRQTSIETSLGTFFSLFSTFAS